MIELFEEFVLIPLIMEIEETPAPGLAPDDEEFDPEGDLSGGEDDDLTKEDDRPEVGGFEFPDTPQNISHVIFRSELEETPMEGTSPEAPGGPAFEEKEEEDEQDSEEDPDAIEEAPHDRKHVGAYEFPEDEDSMI